MIDAIVDTSVLVDLLRGFEPAKDWFGGRGRQRIAITPVVWMETVQGAANKSRRAQAIRFARQGRLVSVSRRFVVNASAVITGSYRQLESPRIETVE